jgi:VanZ family protein
VTFRRILHQARLIDSWLVAPALLFVIYGELSHSHGVDLLESYFWDKALHFTAYFGLCLMTTIAVRADRRALWWAVGLVALGGALEIIQGFTGRDADIFDELANTLGVVSGLGIGWAGVAYLKARALVDGTGEGLASKQN